MIETRLLRNAIVLAKHRSFARAAVELHISQPTLSRNIQLLEQAVGAPLFDRLARSTIPTPVGEELLRHARSVLAASRALEDGMQQFIGLETGSLAVGAGIAVAGGILGPSLVRFYAQYPDVALRALVDDWRRLPEHLRRREVDMFVGEVGECGGDTDLDIEPFPQHPIYFYCRADHPLLALPECRCIDALAWPLVLPELPERLQASFRSMLNDGGSSGSAIQPKIINSNDLAVNRVMVARSDAVGLATFGMLEEPLRRGEFVLLPIRLPELCSNYGLVTRRGASLPPVAEAFATILREEDQALAERERAFIAV